MDDSFDFVGVLLGDLDGVEVLLAESIFVDVSEEDFMSLFESFK